MRGFETKIEDRPEAPLYVGLAPAHEVAVYADVPGEAENLVGTEDYPREVINQADELYTSGDVNAALQLLIDYQKYGSVVLETSGHQPLVVAGSSLFV